ncbi:MAG: DUF2891 domain-containing protein [Pyrinomonadaceae bacterium]|nr:DUF2891 domain-containing protein [Pyrinomonadaceae bacterium]
MKLTLVLIVSCMIFSLAGCTASEKSEGEVSKPGADDNPMADKPKFDKSKAEYLHKFAFECIDKEYPNKLGQVLGDASYLKPPKELHPAFYGCFDWHSSVHGHWTLTVIVNRFPDFEKNDAIIEKLKANITKENIENEVKYFDDKHNKNYERTYGWAWALKLSEALQESENEELNQLAKSLDPLTKLIERKYIEFLPKLTYPIRVGEHTNTAFGLSFAYDYAKKHSKELEALIAKRSKEYYLEDKGCPLTWEPSGFDFLSPCLEEASLMLKVLPKEDFEKWLDGFLPGFRNAPENFIQPAKVSDASDGKLAHLDGLNFSRAWCLYEMGEALENKNLIAAANEHFNFSYRKIDSGEYAGEHWLASFAAYALIKGN